jgi:hypothetical protein
VRGVHTRSSQRSVTAGLMVSNRPPRSIRS